MNSERVKGSSPLAGLLFDSIGPVDRQLFSESAFRHMISIERKRSERSEQPFLLMAIEVTNEEDIEKRQSVLGNIAAALIPASRETDVVGWLKEHATLAVLYTGLAFDDRSVLLSTIQNRVTDLLRGQLPRGQFDRVSISFHYYPDTWDQTKPGAPIDVDLYKDLLHHSRRRRSLLIVKRIVDVVGSSVALLLCLPLFYAIALAIKLTSRGPVYFVQRRVGQFGKTFRMFKFRSMVTGNDSSVHREFVTKMIANDMDRLPEDEKGESVFKLTNDARITRVGRFLRRFSLDELPQFYNVFVGQMSLVGPRPPVPYELKAYRTWHRRRVLEFKPGVTGLWQVSGRSRVTFDEMVRLDLQYAATWSPWLDIKILLRTPLAVVHGAGAH